MSRFELLFRRDGEAPMLETWDDGGDGRQPHIDGRPVVDGQTYTIRGDEWLLRREDIGNGPRFVCTRTATRE